MGIQYAVYKNKKYKIDIDNDLIELISSDINSKKNGFVEYIDILGKLHKDILIKKVKEDELDFAYELDYKVIYKGKTFKVNDIDKFLLMSDPILLFSSDIDDIENYGFERMDKFTYRKEVSIEVIVSLNEIKKPILKLRDRDIEVTAIESKDIKQYLNQMDE